MSGPDEQLGQFVPDEKGLGDFLLDGLKQLPKIPGALGHPLAELPPLEPGGKPEVMLGKLGPAAGVIQGVIGLFSDSAKDQFLGGLKLGETGAGFAAKLAGKGAAASETAVTAGRLSTGLGIGASLLGFAAQWIDAIGGGGFAIQAGVDNARAEGELKGTLSGYAAGLLGMDAQWLIEYGPIHPVHDGTPSQDRAEDTRIEAYQEAKQEGFEAAQRLSDHDALNIVSEVLRYAQERGIHILESRDPWADLTNLVERVLPLMAEEMEAGTWQFRELPEPQADAGDSASEAGEPAQASSPSGAAEPAPTPAARSTGTEIILGDGVTLRTVAEGALEDAWHREPTPAEVAVYMTAVVAANLGALSAPADSSAFSGPVLVLPPVPADPADEADDVPDAETPTDGDDETDAPEAAGPTTDAGDGAEPTDAAPAPDAADAGAPASILPDNADASTGAVDAQPSTSPLPDAADVSTGAVDGGPTAGSPLPDNADVATGEVDSDSDESSPLPDGADVATGDADGGVRENSTAALPDGSDPDSGALPAEPVALPPQEVDVQPVQDDGGGP